MWFSIEDNFAPLRGHLTIFGDVFSYHNSGEGATGIELVETRNTAKHLRMHRTAAPTMKNYLAQNVSGAEVEKPWTR